MIKILYEDKDIVVCIKPPLISSQHDSNGREDMISVLQTQVKSEIKPIHRLDFKVGGVIVYAKSDRAAKKLSMDIQNKSDFEKCYVAILHGKPVNNIGTLKDYLYKSAQGNKAFVVNKKRAGVKEASLEYEVLETLTIDENDYSLVFVKLHTGRFHQIRVQFASRKYPLLGDGKYGSKDNQNKLALWSYSLKFNHPVSNETMYLSSLPDIDEKPWCIFREGFCKIKR